MTAVVGFYGKIPSRGDFVRAGLPNSFVEPWDAWLQTVLPAARATLGDDWDAVWLEAPVWRFLLPAGQCGPASVLGLWMPSLDAAGRHFPLTLAAAFPDDAVPASDAAEAWLDYAEEVGRDAIARDVPPKDLASRLVSGPTLCFQCPTATTRSARWWTEGGPFVSASTTEWSELLPANCFAATVKTQG